MTIKYCSYLFYNQINEVKHNTKLVILSNLTEYYAEIKDTSNMVDRYEYYTD